MIKIKFNSTEQIIDVTFSRITENVVQLIGNIPIITSGFKTYRMNGKQLGDFSDYTTIYRKLDNGIQFSNNNSIYVETAEPSLDELKSQKLSQVDTWTANKITGGFISSTSGEPVRYDSDKDTQITMQGKALNVNTELFAEKYPNGCPVRGYIKGENTKSVLMLSAEQVLQWCADLSIHIGTCKQEGWVKQAEVNACTTKEEIDAIVLE